MSSHDRGRRRLHSANAARAYDYMLGGAHNFAVDRELVDQLLQVNPDVARLCQVNRAYLGRVVRWCTEQGIDQFLDLGSGVPTVGNTHEIAHRANPAARVAYVDFEPDAVAHALEIIRDLDTVTATRADLRNSDAVLSAPGVAGLLDFTRPVAVLALAVLHFVSGDITAVLASYGAVLASGSALAISHGSADQDDPEFAGRLLATCDQYRSSATPGTSRTRGELRALLDGLDVVPPGLVDVAHWPHQQPDTPSVGFTAPSASFPDPAKRGSATAGHSIPPPGRCRRCARVTADQRFLETMGP